MRSDVLRRLPLVGARGCLVETSPTLSVLTVLVSRHSDICRIGWDMAIHPILKMGDPRLLRIAQPVTAFDSDEIHRLVADMFDTMRAANGAGLAAPQIGVDLQLVVFGT